MQKQEISKYDEAYKVEIHPYEHRVRYYETDRSGSVSQTNYARWLENARMELLDQVGFGCEQQEELQVICPLLSESIEYISPFHYQDTVVVAARIVSYDGRKMALEYRLYEKKTKELKATAKSVHCFVNWSGNRISLKNVYPELETTFFEMK